MKRVKQELYNDNKTIMQIIEARQSSDLKSELATLLHNINKKQLMNKIH